MFENERIVVDYLGDVLDTLPLLLGPILESTDGRGIGEDLSLDGA